MFRREAVRGVRVFAGMLAGVMFAPAMVLAATVNSPAPDYTDNEDSGPRTFKFGDYFNWVGAPLLLEADSSDTSKATVSVNMLTEEFTVTPVANANGDTTITIAVTDLVSTAKDDFLFTLKPVNDDPFVVAIPPNVSVAEDSNAYVLDLSTVFGDVDIATDGDVLTFNATLSNASLFTGTSGVSGSILTLKPAPDQFGLSTVNLEARDLQGKNATTSFSFNVSAVNDAPVVVAPPADVTVGEDSGPGSASMVGVFDDVDGDPLTLTVTGFTNAPLFSSAPTASGTNINFTPAADANGSSTVTVEASDGSLTVTTSFDIIVTAQNDAPYVVAPPADVTVAEDSGAGSNSLAGVFDDVDGDVLTLSVTAVSDPTLFSAQPTVTGTTVNFTTAPDANGTATITVEASDGALTASTTFDIIITPVNDAPVVAAAAADVTVAEDSGPGVADLSGVFFDVDGDALTLTVTGFTNAALFSSAPVAAGAVVNFTPAADANGSSTVTVEASDGVFTVSTSFDIIVTAVNDAPYVVAAPADVTVAEDSGAGSNSLAGVFDDVDGDVLTLSVTAVSDPTLFSTQPTATGTTVNFTTAPDANGTATVTVQASDGSLTASTNFDINITPVNDAPVVAMAAADVTVAEDSGPGVADLSGVFFDVDGDALTLTVTGFTNAALFSSAPTAAGTAVNFTPAPNMNGSSTVTVEASDGVLAVSTSFDIIVTAVNDAPYVVAPPTDVTVAEDSGAGSNSLAGVFDDVDGDVLTLSVTAVSDPTLFSTQPTATGTTVNFTTAPDANGTATVTVQASDGSLTASTAFDIVITPVNDAPVVVNPLPDTTLPEDSPPTLIDFSAVFLDVDIATNGDSLTYAASSSDTSLVTVSISGTTLTLTFLPDQNGNVDIDITATDSFGESATDTFVLTVLPVDDVPVAGDDSATMAEDAPAITIDVLANDYLGDVPTSITQAGVTLTIAGQDYPNSSESAPTTVNDPFGNPVTLPNGRVTVQGGTILYEPKANFYGNDYFTYTITDSNGSTATATVSITVTPLNDPPIGQQERSYVMVENTVLTVVAADGVLQGAYDVDTKLLDGSGNEIGGQTLSAILISLPINGSLTFDATTGAFMYTPLVNFVGEDQFSYRITDGVTTSVDPVYIVRIVVTPLPPPPPPPAPGVVVSNYNLSNTPLEQIAGVPSNVLVVMDDSGSMDWNTIITSTLDGGFAISNAAVANGAVRESSYVYLFNLTTNTYPPNSSFGFVLPTQAALDADVDMVGNTYGVWRGRSAKHNSIYYNPEIRYEPWVGLDIQNVPFANANPSAARLNPIDPTRTIDLTVPVNYTANAVPRWRVSGGTKNINVTNFYIPSYWATPATPPIAWNAPRQLIEIRPASGPLPGGMFPGGPARDDCASDGNPNDCTFAQEIVNFANWFVYYRSREYVTKGGMGSVIARSQDLRIGYDTISATTSIPIAQMNDKYTEGNKKALLDNVYKVSSFGGTPLRQALDRAGKTFACSIGADCPILPAPDGTCQRNFTLLFSDGYWNGGSGTPFNEDVDGPRPFDGGRYSDSVPATLADTAMKYYETDLWPTLDNRVPVSARDIAGAPPGTFPGNNPVMHQHMKTYAIGFGIEGTLNPGTIPDDPTVPYAWTDPFDGSLEKIDDMVHAAINGRGTYVNAGNPLQLRAAFESAFLEFTQAASSVSSAAFNSTSLREGTLLYRGFFDLRDNTGDLTATQVSPDGTLAAVPVWSAADRLDLKSPASRIVVTFDRPARLGIPFDFASMSPGQQLILTNSKVEYLRGSRADEQPAGVLRARPAVSGLLGDIVNSSPVFVGQPRAINRDQAPYPTTDLYSSFASAKKNRRPVVYVGANDGMLHGFDAVLGDEVFAYVPNKIIDGTLRYKNELERLTSPFYSHQFYVDLTPQLNDAFVFPSRSALAKSWNTIMVGGLGVGGKGYFALNVTDPDSMYASQATASNSVLWEFTDEDDTYPVDSSGTPLGGAVGAVTDPDGRPVKDLGYAVTAPTIAMSNVDSGSGDKKWVSVFGNGINSTAGIAKLFVMFIDEGRDGWSASDFVKLSTGVGVPMIPEQRAGFPNALGTPALIDQDLNGTVDLAYAGDLLGNLYRFDLKDPSPANWTVTRLFTATYDDGTRQPITKQPLVVKHPTQQGFLVVFGTGSFVTKEDASNEDIQSVYGIWDRLENVPATAAADTRATRLVEQVVTNVVEEVGGVLVTRRIITKNPVAYAPDGVGVGVYGWYFDFDMTRATTTTSGNPNIDSSGYAPPSPQFPGEKAVRRLVVRDGTVITTTVLPATGQASCFGARPGAVMLFDVLTGGDPGRPVIDFNNDDVVDNNDFVVVGGEEFAAGLLFNQTDLDGALVDISTLGGEADTDFLFISGGNETIALRIADLNTGRTGRLTWREIQDVN